MRMKRIPVALVLAAVACASSNTPSSPPTSVPTALTFDQLQSQIGHKLARPAASLNADLRQTGLLSKSGDTFGDRSAVTSYLWNNHVVIVRQGKPVAGYTLRGKVKRDDAIFETRADGAEQVLLPPRMPSGASPSPGTVITTALILSDGWLIQVSIAGNTQVGVVTTETLKTFVAGVEL